jgi:hypothetical protein
MAVSTALRRAEVSVDNFGAYARVPTLVAQRLRSETYESPALPLSYSATDVVLRSTRGLSNEHRPRIPTVDILSNRLGWTASTRCCRSSTPLAIGLNLGSGLLVADQRLAQHCAQVAKIVVLRPSAFHDQLFPQLPRGQAPQNIGGRLDVPMGAEQSVAV